MFLSVSNGGELGIRTPGPFQVNGFQDRRFRPLSQLSLSLDVAARVSILYAFLRSIVNKIFVCDSFLSIKEGPTHRNSTFEPAENLPFIAIRIKVSI